MEILASWTVYLTMGIVMGAVLIYLYFLNTYSYWQRRGVPFMKPSLPFGNIKDILFLRRVVGEVYGDAYRYHPNEKLCGIFLVVQPAVVLRDPETIRSFLVKDFVNFHDRGMYFNEDIDPLSAHLFFLNGLRWKTLRNKLTPTFTSGKMKMMFQTLLNCGKQLQSHLEQSAALEETIEIKDVLARFSTDVIASCAFGIQCNCLENADAEFRVMGRKFFDPNLINIIGILLNFMTPTLASILKIKSIAPDVTAFFQRVVRETIEYREENSVIRNDFLQLLIDLKNNGYIDTEKDADNLNTVTGSHKLEMHEIAAQVFVFFIAGFETSSTTMGFCLYELACHPELQERLRSEMDSVLAKHNHIISYDALQEMEYLEKVVAETLRKYPPVPLLNRVCTQEYAMPGTEIVLEKDTNVIIPVYALHHDPQHYPQPEVFDPERFSDEAKAKRHHYVYLPFGEGPRICIGMRFGLMQTKVGLATLLTKYEFNVSDKTVIPLVMDPKSFILSPPGGIFLQITKRTVEQHIAPQSTNSLLTD